MRDCGKFSINKTYVISNVGFDDINDDATRWLHTLIHIYVYIYIYIIQ